MCHQVRRDSSAIAFISTLFYWLKPLTDEGGEEIEGSGPERYISNMLYSQDIPFCSGTLEIEVLKHGCITEREWLNGWMDGWLGAWVSKEWLNEERSKWINEWVHDLTVICRLKNSLFIALSAYKGFPTRMVYLYYISCLRYTILVRNPRYITGVYQVLSAHPGTEHSWTACRHINERAYEQNPAATFRTTIIAFIFLSAHHHQHHHHHHPYLHYHHKDYIHYHHHPQ